MNKIQMILCIESALQKSCNICQNYSCQNTTLVIQKGCFFGARQILENLSSGLLPEKVEQSFNSYKKIWIDTGTFYCLQK